MAALTFSDQAFLASTKSSFSPASLVNLEGWLKADSFTDLIDGSPVGLVGDEWIDQSGNGYDAFGAAGNPTWQTNEVGTKPIVRFPGAGIFLNIPEIVFTGDFTVMFVCKVAVGADTLCLGHNTLNHQMRRNSGGVNDASFFEGVTQVFSAAFVGASSALQMLTYRRLAGTVSWRQNKTARGTGVAALTAKFDSLVNNVFLGTGNMDLAELVFYTDHKSDVECDELYDDYFKPRWVTLP
jgi:hypothetical protein